MYRLVRAGVIVLLVLLVLLLLIPIGMRIAVSSHLYDSTAKAPQAAFAIVLGASVYGETLSPILAARANAAIELYTEGKVSKILVTGDDDARANYDEVTPVERYLQAAGIPAGAIVPDYAGFDTYSSMYRARTVFGVTSAAIVTQDFHLPRAVYLARSLGIQAYGFEASGSGSVWDYLREIPASAKALFDLAIHRIPTAVPPAS